MESEWSYHGECGPEHWSRRFASARGKHQSPIDIDTKQSRFDASLAATAESPLVIDYDHHSCSQIKNSGHTFQIDAYHATLSTVSGGPLKHEHKFLQFHMHWGDRADCGSEHLIDGHSFAAELHFVNWNHELHPSWKAAIESGNNDGIAVLGVMIKVGKFNAEFEKLFSQFEKIHLKGEHVLVRNIDMLKLMPHNTRDYWTYPGSLTTPPCYESVQWIVFREPVEISAEQLEKCRNLYCVSKKELCNDRTAIRCNYRPVCPIGDRIVRKSFKD